MIPALLGGAAVAALISAGVCRVQMIKGPLDAADEEHKTHERATPTSGGIGIAVGYAIALTMLARIPALALLDRQASALVSLLSIFTFVFLLIGFIDDTRRLGPRFKLLLFTALAIGSAITMGIVDTLPLGGGQMIKLGLSIGLFGTALWVFTLVNCVNFMDGANGLSLGSMLFGLLTLGAIGVAEGSTAAAGLGFCTAGAIVGFLFWNFPRGAIFAGDAGALFTGSVAALTSLILIARFDLSPFIPPLLFLPLLADALLTLAWRVSRRQPLLVGHQEHAYQIAIRAGLPAMQVTLIYWALMAVLGLLGFYLSRLHDSSAPWIVFSLVALAFLAGYVAVRRFAKARGYDQAAVA